ncbi:MAG: TilS substrate-binding domain-containing protein [Candidatus Poseidoniaceae archaeon]
MPPQIQRRVLRRWLCGFGTLT